MKNSKAGTTVESGHIKETAIVEPGKYYLLVYFKYSIPPLLFRSHIVCRESVATSYAESILS